MRVSIGSAAAFTLLSHISTTCAFTTSVSVSKRQWGTTTTRFSSSDDVIDITPASSESVPDDGDWDGNVVDGGIIKGCTVISDGVAKYEISIDGVEADLATFSESVYKKIISDAKQQSYQGYRAGSLPPQLEPTYREFTMDEVAREATLEALQQNDIIPFESARSEITIENVSVPPPPPRKKKKKSRKKLKNQADGEVSAEVVVEVVPEWKTYKDVSGAVAAGWKPGQSFSFVAKNVKGQKDPNSKNDKSILGEGN
mmetsp:Transcript_29816/g.34294  ORF Transcript_29816/g.34294 Transcript_29816/m.34294 type:complete len:256 (-) Transcript_29816:122-889(-)